MREVLDSLLATNTRASFLHLTARRNQWGPLDVSILIQEIMRLGEERINATESHENDDKGTSEEDEEVAGDVDTKDTEGDSIQETESVESNDDVPATANQTATEDDVKNEPSVEKDEEKEELKPLRLAYVDIGWNRFSEDLQGAKAFARALQKLIESPDQCPTTLRFDVCGLGPAACRAVGKVGNH